MPPTLTPQSRFSWALVAILLPCAFILNCQPGGASRRSLREIPAYPPAPQTPQVLALGNIRSGQPPSTAEVQVSQILFGAEPDQGIGLVKPVSVAWQAGRLMICDGALGAVVEWNSDSRAMSEPRWGDRPRKPVSVRAAPNGGWLIVDAAAASILRYGPQNELRRRYTSAQNEFRPACAIEMDSKVLVADAGNHAIADFSAIDGGLLGTFGRRGPGPAEFGAPLGMAVTPDGNICVVDTLNNRVQLLDSNGKWIRNIGGPGNQVGCLGRPKDVAVGPDGTIFVTDAASQRVHVFDQKGRVLMAFGEPGSGVGALSMPAGICICETCPVIGAALPDGFKVAYYIAVAEQLLTPGIRVYAWRDQADAQRFRAAEKSPIQQNSLVINPHRTPNDCKSCHASDSAHPGKLKPETVDAICLTCHDGKKALAEAHPIGRLARTSNTLPPSDWPLVDGRIGCMTCHDLTGHDSPAHAGKSNNPAFVRGFDADHSMDFCSQCHKSEGFKRFNPHIQLAADQSVNEATCMTCHNPQPPNSPTGIRGPSANLRVSGSDLCLTCHTRHWDVSPRGHVDRNVPPEIRQFMEAKAGGSAAMFPLAQNQVTCYSCHNPHQAGLFPADSPLGSLARHAADAAVHLRVDLIDLCLGCHAK